MKKFLRALFLFIRMYKRGFYFSENSHKSKDGSNWGFYRFNHKTEPNLFDIDYDFSKDGSGYFHVHGSKTRKHWDNKGTVTSKYKFE